jgi:hypothetical protein
MTKPFRGYEKIDLVTSTLAFDVLIKNFTSAISFEWYVLELWYFTWVFIVTKTFHGYQINWTCELDQLIHKFLLNGMYLNFDISHECFFWQDLSMGFNKFDLDLSVWPTYWKPKPCLYLLNGMYQDIDILHECLLWQDLWMGTNRWPCDLEHYIWLTYWKL